MRRRLLLLLLRCAWLLRLISSTQASIDFRSDCGAIPDDNRPSTCAHNTAVLQRALHSQCLSNNLLRIPWNRTFYLHHGVIATNLTNAAIQVDGNLMFQRQSNKPELPAEDNKGISFLVPRASLLFDNCSNITITSSSSNLAANSSTFTPRKGVVDGQGSQYWGSPLIRNVASTLERRPNLLEFRGCQTVVVENIVLQDAPYHSLELSQVQDASIKSTSIVTRRTSQDGHSWIDLLATETVGIKIGSGCRDVHVQDVDIWSQDDCVAIVSEPTDSRMHTTTDMSYDSANARIAAAVSNILVERVNASGMGFAIQSVGATAQVNNITFRDAYLHKSVRGVSVKFHTGDSNKLGHSVSSGGGIVSNVVFENIYMESPTQWPIWLGPTQTISASAPDPCRNQLCSLCWPDSVTTTTNTPDTPYSGVQCHAVANSTLVNATFFNVTVHNPRRSPGVLLGNADRQAIIENVVMDRVKVFLSPRNATYLHPYANSLWETFPGLRQPLHDKYIPHSTNSYNASDQDEAIVQDESEHSILSQYLLVGLVLSAILLASLPIVVTVKSSDEGNSNPVTDLASPRTPSDYSSSHQLQGHLSLDESTTRTDTKRVRFDESALKDLDDVPLATGDTEHEVLSLTQPLLDRQQPQDVTPPHFRRVSESFHWSHRHWAGVLVFLTVSGLGTWCYRYYKLHDHNRNDPNTPVWDKTDRYYMCEGVVRGLAKGGTWPVPYCLNQHPSQWWVLLLHLHGASLWIVLGALGTALLVGITLWAWRHCKRRDHCEIDLIASLPTVD